MRSVNYNGRGRFDDTRSAINTRQTPLVNGTPHPLRSPPRDVYGGQVKDVIEFSGVVQLSPWVFLYVGVPKLLITPMLITHAWFRNFKPRVWYQSSDWLQKGCFVTSKLTLQSWPSYKSYRYEKVFIENRHGGRIYPLAQILSWGMLSLHKQVRFREKAPEEKKNTKIG